MITHPILRFARLLIAAFAVKSTNCKWYSSDQFHARKRISAVNVAVFVFVKSADAFRSSISMFNGAKL